MKLIVQVSDNNGILFNNRRQSRDIEVIKDVIKLAKGRKIYIDMYSESLFEGYDFISDKEYLKAAGKDDFCFYEKGEINEYMKDVSEIFIYRWNRDYPADCFFEVDKRKFHLDSSIDFKGNSHDCITRERWIR